LPEVEVSAESAPETGGLGAEVEPGWATPALLDDLRVRMERVRARLGTLVDATAAEGDGPPTPRTVVVPVDLLEELGEGLVAARALLGQAADALQEDEAPEDTLRAPAGRETACMVALNMALNGASRGETERYFAEHFVLPDAGEIIADAYAYRERMRAAGATPSS
jgi:hypothetical protein